jgi:BMFP domain-containing protein YqiC
MHSNPYDEIPRPFTHRLGRFLAHLKKECNPVLEDFMHYAIKKMDLVNRQELEAQIRTLERAQQKLCSLEASLQALQSAKNG